MANLVSLFGAVSANGYKLIENPSRFFQDCSAASILWVKQPVSVTNINGAVVQAFEIMYQNPKGLTVDSYFLPVTPTLTSLSDFLTGLGVVGGARNQFTIYTDLIKTSNQPSNLLPGNQDVLINNDFIYAVNYLAVSNQTAVTLNVVNYLSKFIMYFAGDQEAGGRYAYFGSGGNVAP